VIPHKPVTLRVGNNLKERRTDKYLHNRFCNYSREIIQQTIKAKKVKVNGEPVKPSTKLQAGDIIEVILPEQPSKEIEPENIPLDIIHEDAEIIIINKPANMIVHPARSNVRGTLVNALLYRFKNLSSGLGERRPGIVHRLDRNTTGVMVVAKNDVAQEKIAKQFRNRTVGKTYLAVAHGCPELDADGIKLPLGIHPRKREKYAVRHDIGKQAISFYRVKERFRGFSLLEVTIKTGRTHQIRVHLSHIKHPVVADDMYGGKLVYPWQLKDQSRQIEEPVIKRCALHAFSLELTHPASGKRVKFEAPVPPDMQNLLDMLRKYRKS